jgi:hypothetical protein
MHAWWAYQACKVNLSKICCFYKVKDNLVVLDILWYNNNNNNIYLLQMGCRPVAL